MTFTAIVVDDVAVIVRLISDLLESRGINVIGTAFDGDEAVKVYKKMKPDIVFLDVTMPKHDGVYALKEIRKINNKANVIMITPDLSKETIDTLTGLEACAIVYKPFDIEEMIQTVDKVMVNR